MADSTFHKIKKSALDFATVSAAKIEAVTKAGKLRLDIMADEHRLQEKYAELGEKTFQSLQANRLSSLSEDPYVIELTGAIAENQARLADMRSRLDGDKAE